MSKFTTIRSLLNALAKAMNLIDPTIENHHQETAYLAYQLGVEMGLETESLKYTTLRENYLINSTRKFDDMGDWLYFKLMVKNAGTLLRRDKEKLDKLYDEMFYDYRG